MEKLGKILGEIVKAAAGEGEGFDAKFVMSAATPDRMSDTINPDTYETAARKKKLIALWQHDKTSPIGYWSNLARVGDTLTGFLKLADVPLGFTVKQLIADGVPLAASIGFRGRAEPNKKGGYHFEEIDLMECSVVSTPAHQRAVMVAMKSFNVDERFQLELGVDDEDRKRAASALGKSLLVLTR